MAALARDIPGEPSPGSEPGEASAYRVLWSVGVGLARVFSIIALAAGLGAVRALGRGDALHAARRSVPSSSGSGMTRRRRFPPNAAVTLYRACAGFLIGAFAGISVGHGHFSQRSRELVFDPIISVGFPMPKIAFRRWSSCGSASTTCRRLPWWRWKQSPRGCRHRRRHPRRRA